MGKLIAIDGVDASGKQTQTSLLYERLVKLGIRVRKVSFPAYGSPSSELVKMYLAGEFGKSPADVNAYAASTFYAADRFATYRRDWRRDYKNDTLILADRYVSSNMIHQGGKIAVSEEKDRFLDWLYELEHKIYDLPVPDLTIFLDMPVKQASELMKNRDNKITGASEKDIHETSLDYLTASYENACYIAEKYGWRTVRCAPHGEVRSMEDINEEIMALVLPLIS